MTKEQILDELHQIAQELNLSFDNDEVLTQWCRRNKSIVPKDIMDEIFSIHTSKGRECKKVSAIIDDNGHVTHVKTEYDDNYRLL